MSIAVGDRIPDVTVQLSGPEGHQSVSSASLFAGKRVLLFAVPGAFTPTCSAKHLPGYRSQIQALRDKGIERVLCLAVNDPFVMRAWGESQGDLAGIELIADGNAAFTRALGLELDATGFGMGIRSKRFALVASDGVVEKLEVEAPGEFKVSSAEAMLGIL